LAGESNAWPAASIVHMKSLQELNPEAVQQRCYANGSMQPDVSAGDAGHRRKEARPESSTV